MTRPLNEFEAVQSCIQKGANDCEISRLTGVPREVVRYWRKGGGSTYQRQRGGDYSCQTKHDFSELPYADYAYLLGMYLGDGCLSEHPRSVYRLRIVSDSFYPGIIAECCRAIEAVMPKQRAYQLKRSSRCIEISMFSKHWICFFPQHGPGRKHERLIQLEPWQREIVSNETESFVRGLIHSDGCRVVANDRGVRSVRYHFSNRSEDIKSLFCSALDSLGITWTRPDDRGIAIYRKAAVARLDEFIGPKK